MTRNRVPYSIELITNEACRVIDLRMQTTKGNYLYQHWVNVPFPNVQYWIASLLSLHPNKLLLRLIFFVQEQAAQGLVGYD